MLSYVPLGIRTAPYEHTVVLKIGRKPGKKNKYVYEFEENEFVMQDKNDTIKFSIRPEKNIHDARCWIAAHCCTRAKALLRVLPENTSETLSDVYETGTTDATFRFEIETNELVHVGLIVAIWESNETKPRYILCDPQVGNGPPGVFVDAFILL